MIKSREDTSSNEESDFGNNNIWNNAEDDDIMGLYCGGYVYGININTE
jgi:hypothetical protein